MEYVRSPETTPYIYLWSKAVELGKKYDDKPITITPNVPTVIGLDPAFGSSKFAIVVSQYVNETIVVTHCSECQRLTSQTQLIKFLK
jgi:hypothetical protein